MLEPQLSDIDASGAADIAAIYSESRDDQKTMTVLGTFYCPSKVSEIRSDLWKLLTLCVYLLVADSIA